jgi:hypothetical protein
LRFNQEEHENEKAKLNEIIKDQQLVMSLLEENKTLKEKI